jgi:hypothetical protein
MNNDETIFGVNFVDGRIKGYPKYQPGTTQANKMYFRMVRGNTEYGINNFVDNGNGTISGLATGLMWQKTDDGVAKNWEQALYQNPFIAETYLHSFVLFFARTMPREILFFSNLSA